MQTGLKNSEFEALKALNTNTFKFCIKIFISNLN